ncbi:hypothetical protein [Nonomuraea jiangxiensis]|uniref:Uncharacterized protein n=1 Tax=Nonomuraea jiangxiensis TaxID=633440 RepID=A0A1G9JF42_9ACTN|nr:hypothetical protein [Nonomuraea jiangxiensis]SDL36180.1 hypothetical protein SAMN05421869_12522 [Nonomuraea jiangxiensis]
MRDGNLQFIVATLDELGVRPDPRDRSGLSALADMDPQMVRLVLDLMRKAHEAGRVTGGKAP